MTRDMYYQRIVDTVVANIQGVMVSPWDPCAVTFSLRGAISRVTGGLDSKNGKTMYKAFREALKARPVPVSLRTFEAHCKDASEILALIEETIDAIKE